YETYVTFTHPENVIAQWASEWGLLIALMGTITLVVALRPASVLTAARPPIGAWVAIVVCVLHDFVDFHLEVPGMTVLVAVCVAIVVGAHAVRKETSPIPLLAGHARSFALASAIATPLASILVLANLGHGLSQDRARVAEMARSRSLDKETFLATVRTAM